MLNKLFPINALICVSSSMGILKTFTNMERSKSIQCLSEDNIVCAEGFICQNICAPLQ